MMSTHRPAPPVVSLQAKLDHIAHERDVLALQRTLAQLGLRDGDPVCSLDGGTRGRLLIARDESPPRLLVRADDGVLTDFAPARWRHA
jgi:hypothetical protein